MASAPEYRYAWSDVAQVAYQVVGSEGPDLLAMLAALPSARLVELGAAARAVKEP